jgi:putative CocE/NonD family hydrolase
MNPFPESASLVTRDGIRLDADIYRPADPGEYPVLLMRQPYGRKIASTVVYAHPQWYADQGYIVVIQDVRGRGTSEGSFVPFAYEIQDGADTVAWAAQLPGSTGDVGMYGFSYQGMTQMYAAVERPVALKTLCPAMVAYDLYRDMAYEGGAFRWQMQLSWGIQLEAETARLHKNAEAQQALYAASRHLPLYERIPTRPQVLQTYAPQAAYFEWLDHPDPEAKYWISFSAKSYWEADQIDLPMLHIGGWWDSYLQGTLRFYRAMAKRSAYSQYLVVGPWAHLPWSRKVGDVDYGSEAESPIDHLQIQWFDYFLKGKQTNLLQEAPILLFEMGSNLWRWFQEWPSPDPKCLYLLGGNSVSQGSLGVTQAETQSRMSFVHDPWRPVPSLGGHNSLPAGPFERSSLDGRTDVLTYTSDPLAEDLHLAGDIWVQAWVTADHVSFDLCAVLSEVRPEGVFPISQGYTRWDSRSELPLQLLLQPTCAYLRRGHALRLSLSAASFPAYAVNPGTGSKAGEATLLEAEVITLTVTMGSGSDSCLYLSSVSPA